MYEMSQKRLKCGFIQYERYLLPGSDSWMKRHFHLLNSI